MVHERNVSFYFVIMRVRYIKIHLLLDYIICQKLTHNQINYVSLVKMVPDNNFICSL